MSLCLITETKDCIWLGGDSAVSYRIVGKDYRGRDEVFEKAFQHKNAVFFIGGSISTALAVRQYIEQLPRLTEDRIAGIAAQMGRVAMDEQGLLPNRETRIVLLMVLLDTGRIYGISENNHFVIEHPEPPPFTETFRSHCCVGVLDEDGGKGRMLAKKYFAETSDVLKTYAGVYSDMSSNNVGGYVDVYQLNIAEQTITRHKVEITEGQIEYVEFLHPVPHAQMGAGSYINWNQVNSDPLTEDAYDLADSASDAATNAVNNIKKLANGSYTGGTFIDGKSISAPYITGGRITGVEIIGGYIKSNSTIDVTTDIKLGGRITLQSSSASIVSSGHCSIDFVGDNIRISGMGGVDISGANFYNGQITGVSKINGVSCDALVSRIAALESKVAALQAAKA